MRPKPFDAKIALPAATIRILNHLNNTLNIPRTGAPPENWSEIAESLPEDNVIRRLVQDNPQEKAALAELYLKHSREGQGSRDLWTFSAGSGSPHVFFESGSTVAYLADGLKQYWGGTSPAKDAAPFTASTNNNLVALLYIREGSGRSGVDPRNRHWPPVPRLFPGYLEPKYHGLFPFHIQKLETKLKEEQVGYADCRLRLSQCQVLLLAASRLSLVHGPLVGSRENAIFKNACYNACVPPVGLPSTHEVHLFITADKLIRHTGAASDAFPNTLRRENEKLKDGRCFPVFSIQDDYEAPTKWLCRDDNQPLRDGSRAVRLGSARFRVCDSWLSMFSKAGVKVQVFVAYKSDDDGNVINREVKFAQTECRSAGVNFKWEPKIGRLDGGSPFRLGLILIEGIEK